jgi:long-chain fatty acid transport protein
MQRLCSALALSAVVIAAAASPATAQGFGVFEHGTCAMARAGAGSAAPCQDGSAIFFNPAGLAGMRGWSLSVGATGISALGSFVDDLSGGETDMDNDPIPVPHLYAAYGITDRLTAGIGTFAPYGLATKWPDTFAGRFNGFDNELRSIYMQPTLAYRLNDRISMGAGFAFVIGSVEINQRLDLSAQTAPAPFPPGTTLRQLGIPFHTDFAQARLRATGATGVGGNFGLRVEATDRVSFGARYLTSVRLDYDGTAAFEAVSTGIILPPANPFGVPGGTPLDAVIARLGLFSAGAALTDQGLTTTITMPGQLLTGVAFQVTPQLLVLADYQWVNWSKFGQVELDFANPATPDQTLQENYRDTSGVRLGVDWAASKRWTLRGGYVYHEAAAPDETVTPLLPEGSRNEFTAGVGFQASNRVRVDVAYQFVKQGDRPGRVREIRPGETAAEVNTGLYKSRAHLFGATITLH